MALAAAFALSGCFYPHRTCSDQIVTPSPVESAVLEADKELHLSQQESLIVGRLTLMQGAKEITGEGRRIILINQENENVGVLKDAVLSGSTYYLIVPPGRYYLETDRPTLIPLSQVYKIWDKGFSADPYDPRSTQGRGSVLIRGAVRQYQNHAPNGV